MSIAPASVVTADPPWRFSDSLPGNGRGATKHYPTLPARDIEALVLPPIAGDALLFLWRVASMQEEALREVRVTHWAYFTERKDRLCKAGLCIDCGRAARPDRLHCWTCGERRTRFQRWNPAYRVMRCGLCKTTGHDRRRCGAPT